MAGGMVAQGITIKFDANTSGLTDGAAKAQSVIGGFAKVGGALLIGMGVAAVGAGIAATKMAGDFQAGMTSLVTGAGEASSNIKLVSNGILDLATETGTSTQQLTAGMYMIESAGYHGADGLNVLKVAAEGAKVGNADLGTVANAVTTVLTDYHMKSTQAAAAMNGLITTVASGKTHMQDLANSMGSVLPLASSLGISFPQVAGAIATMTNAGMDAQRASQNLANAIRSLSAPSSTATKAMAEVGINAQDLKDTLSTKGLTAAIQMVTDDVGKKFPAGSTQAVTAFKNIMGGATGYNVALMLGGKNMDAYKANVDAITKAMNAGGNSVEGWSNIQNDFNFKVDQAKETLEVLGIKIGTALLPAVGNLLSKIMPLIEQFGNWIVDSGIAVSAAQALGDGLSGLGGAISSVVGFFSRVQPAATALKVLALGLAGAIGGALVYAFYAWAASMIPVAIEVLAITWPFLAIGAAIGLLVAGIIILVQHWNQLIAAIPSPIIKIVSGMFQELGGFIASEFNPVIKQLTDMWNKDMLPALKQLWQLIVQLTPLWQILGGIIAGVVIVSLGLLIATIKGVVAALAAFLSGVITVLGGIGKIFQGFVLVVSGILQLVADIFTGKWNKILGDLRVVGSGLVKIVQGFCQAIWGVISGVFNTISAFIGGFVNGIITFFQNLYNAVVGHSIIPDMVNGILNWFGQLPGKAMNFINSLISQITGKLSQLGSAAARWSADMMQNFINGIYRAIGGVGSAVAAVANKIKSFLGFSKPDIGPLADSDTWMSDFGDLLNKGMNQQVPKLQIAANKIAMTISGTKPSTMTASNAQSPSVINIPPTDIYIDGQKMTNALGKYIANQIRLQGGVRKR